MISANELRIGNWVYSYNPKTMNHLHLLKVKARNIHHLEENPKSETYQPIPLTAEILKKCGFNENKNWFYKSNFILGYLSTDDNLQAEWQFGGAEGGWNLIDIKYLHQLQNIVHALTGEELEYKQ